jgi:hypothetical protein
MGFKPLSLALHDHGPLHSNLPTLRFSVLIYKREMIILPTS